jgi:hypothetical protein
MIHINRERRVLPYIESFQTRERAAIVRNQEVDIGLLALMNKCNGQLVEASGVAPRLGSKDDIVVGGHRKPRSKQDFDLAGIRRSA